LTSHLLPAGFYRLLRDPDKRNPHPIIVGQDTSIQTAAQVEGKLLCRVCEQRFNNKGERWVLQNCFRCAGEFKILDMLKTAKALSPLDDGAIYAGAQILSVNVDALVYFAASVVWRAAARQWDFPDSRDQLSLGPYREDFRLYLVGEAGFPKSAAVWVNVWTSPVNLCVLPRTLSAQGYRHHNFSVPGITFHVFVGQRIPLGARLACAARSPERMILLSNRMNGPMLQGIARMVISSRAKGSLGRK